jgi:hypothetical protein
MEIHEKGAGPFDCGRLFCGQGRCDDLCRDLAEKFATLIDLIEDEVDNAMMMIPRDAARAEAQTIDHRPPA